MKKSRILFYLCLIIIITSLSACNNNNSDKLDVEIIKDIHNSPLITEDLRPEVDYTKDKIIIDNNNREFTYTSAILKTANNKASFIGNDFIESANGTDFTAKWTPNINKAGYYKIYIIWPEINNIESVKIEIGYEGGANIDTTKVFNQRHNAGYWVYIGTYYLTSGTGNYVQIKGEEGKTFVLDAVMFDLSLEIEEIQQEIPLQNTTAFTPGSTVRIIKEQTGEFRLSCDGELFFADGIADVQELELMAKAGINAARVYSTKALDDGKLLERAEELGIKIVIGLWLNHESASFNYKNNPEAVKQQFEELKVEINKYKQYPAVLAWAVGNEVDKSTSNNPLEIYQAMNDIAKYIHEADPYHPTMAVLAGASQIKMSYIKRYVPHIDIITVNTYKHVSQANDKVNHAWNGPYMIGEYAIDQPSEIKIKTSWGAIIEPNDEEKASIYSQRYLDYMLAMQDEGCVGSFAFKDTGAFRVTHTWYNLILDGKMTPTYYAMKNVWTKQQESINVPVISKVYIDGKEQTSSVIVDADTEHHITVEVGNDEGENLTYVYEIRKDAGIAINKVPAIINNIEFIDVEGKKNEKKFLAPKYPGEYRLFVYVYNDKNQITSYSFPFKVEGEPFVLEEQEGVQIIDTHSENFISEGIWQVSTNQPYNGELTLFTRENNAHAMFIPTFTQPGMYRVYFYNLSESMGDYDDAEIQIDIYFNNNQKETMILNIINMPYGWIELGEFNFTGIGIENVTITKISSSTKVTRATAVGFLPILNDED